MKNVGIYCLSPVDYLYGYKIDKLLYLYDKIYLNECYEIETLLPIIKKLGYEKGYRTKLSEIENLEKDGLIEILNESRLPKVNNDLLQKMADRAYEISYEVAYNSKTKGIEYFFDILESQIKIQDLNSRRFAIKLNTVKKNNYAPILLDPQDEFIEEYTVKNALVYSIIMKNIPLPKTSDYSQLLELKNDPDFTLKLLRLRNWANDTTNQNLTPIQLEQKLEYLIEEYTNQFSLHKLKHQTSFLESFVTLTFSTIENLAKLKFGDLAKTIFELKKADIAFLEAETNFIGREIALIHKIKAANL